MSKFRFRCTLSLFKLNMDENIFKYGSYDVDKGTLLKSLLHENNIRSFSRHKRYTPEQESEFRNIVYYLQNGIKNNTISGTGFGKFTDVSETPMEYSEIYGDALNYVHQIANKIGDSKPKQKIVKEDGEVTKVFDINKHGFLNYFLTQLEPFNTTGEFGADVITGYRNLFENDLSKAILDFNNKISEYQKKYNNFKDLDFSTIPITAEEYNQELENLKKGLADGSVDAVDRSLARRLNVSLLLNAVFGSESNPILSSLKKDTNSNIDSDIIKARAFLKELQSEIDNVTSTDSTNSVSYLDYNKVESSNKNLTNSFNFSEFWDGIDINDKVRLGLIIPELGSAISALIPSYGTLVSGILGIGTTATGFVNDLFDADDVSVVQAFRNLGLGLTFDVVGLLPGAGLGTKAAKVGKFLKPVANTLVTAFGAVGLHLSVNALNKIINDPKNVTTEDFQALSIGILALSGYVVNKGVKRSVKRNTSLTNEVTVRTKNGKDVNISEEQLEELKSTKGLSAQNAKFKEWTGEELQQEFKPANFTITPKKINTFNPKKVRLFLSGPHVTTTPVRTLLPESDDVLLKKIYINKNSESPELIELNVELSKRLDFDEVPKIEKIEETPIETSKPNTTEGDTPQVTTEKPKESQTLEESTLVSEVKPDVLSEVSRENIKKYKGKINTLNQVNNALKLTTSSEEYKVVSQLLDRLKKNSNFKTSKKIRKDGKGGSQDFQSFVNYVMRATGCDLEEAVKIGKKFGFHKQGGILKAEGGIKFDNVDLLNHSKYQGWNEFFNYDITTGNLSLKPNYDKEKFNAWLTANNLLFNAPTKNYGNNYTIPEGDYTTVYNPNAMSVRLKGANNDKRAKNLIPSNTDNELNLNNHLKNNSMYLGEYEKNRVSDLSTFYNNYGKDMSLDDFLKHYNSIIDKFYDFKRSDEGITYKESDDAEAFNSKHYEVYRSHNDLKGYDPNSIRINGTATMARGVDITNSDIELDMSSDANFSKMLGNKKLYKAADGRLYYIDPATAKLSTLDVKDSDKPGVTHDMGGGGNDDKIPDPLPTKKDYVDYQIPISTAQLLGALYANKKMYEINNLIKPLLYSPKEDYRWTYGNLRAMVAGKKQAADLARQVARPLTSDGSLQTTAAFEAFDQGQKYIQEGERIDDETLTENMEKAWLQNLENHENRYNIAMKNRENMHQVDREKLLAKANWFRANYESIDNFTNAMKTLIVTDLRKKESMLDMYHQLGLRQWSERNPGLIVDNWGKNEQSLWEKGTSGLEMTPEEQANYNKLRELVNVGYYRMLAADSNVYLTKPDAKSIEYPFKITIAPQDKRGGKITTEMSKTIISFLKEKNKNYNKAIDRSIRGLYNHIKLQRK